MSVLQVRAVQSQRPVFDARCDLPNDIRTSLFEQCFSSEVFMRWSSLPISWQFYCSGTPGSGKTSLAKATARLLKNRKDVRDRGIPVAFVSILGSLNSCDKSVIGEVRNAIDSQLQGRPSSPAAYPSGYLILDGYDQFDRDAQMHIDHELSLLQAGGINVMTTGRSPRSFEAVDEIMDCDNCQRSNLDLYWICRQCWKGDIETCYSLCNSCKMKGAACAVDGHALAFEEMYDHRQFHMNLLTRKDFRRFIQEDMAKEYDLVINRFSSRFETTSSGALSEHLMTFMLPEYNIALMRAHMEEVHQMQSWDKTARSYDRLFPSVIDLFDNVIKHIEKQNPQQRTLGLLSIAAAALRDDGISFSDLESQLQKLGGDFTQIAIDNPLDPENVFNSAKGFLMVDTLRVSCYVPLFACYVREGYNKTLLWAKAKLEAAGETQSQELPVQTLDEVHQASSPSPISPPLSIGYSTTDSSIHSGYFSNFSTMVSMEDIGNPLDHMAADYPEEALSATKQICTICENMIKGKESERTLTTTLEKFKQSVAERCILCTSVWKDVQRWSTDGQQRYCKWTVRRKPCLRETEESLIVTYRLTSKGNDARNPLTQKIFHMIPAIDVKRQMNTIPITETTHPGDDSTSQIRDWLHVCQEHHTACRVPYTATWVPTRLIDLKTGDPDRLRVVYTKDEDICTPYVTLSHCWGNFKEVPFLTLTLSNKSKLMGEGIILRDLPRNFIDAVAVARHMGVRYIWIDSLCIIQDNGEFARSEGQLMHKVYRHSYCNISAADSLDSRGGLFRRRDPETIRHAVYEEDGSSNLLTKGLWIVLEDDLWQTHVLGMNIYTRGWVYQERMLSPRVLHFTRNQIFWDCCTLSASESLPFGIPFAIDTTSRTERHWRARLQAIKIGRTLSGPANVSLESFWQEAVVNYTSCKLTNQADKTIAIWSIAKLVRDSLQEEYAAGLWELRLEEQLAWSVIDPKPVNGDRELQSRFPRWSWASVNSAVKTSNRLVPPRFYTAKSHSGDAICFKIKKPTSIIKTEEFDPRDLEPELEASSLDVCGYMKQVAWTTNANQEIPMLSLASSSDVPGLSRPLLDGFEVFLDEVGPKSSDPNESFYLFILAVSETSGFTTFITSAIDHPAPKYSGVGLLLTPSDGIPSDLDILAGHYYRKGVVHFHNVDANTWELVQEGYETKIWLD